MSLNPITSAAEIRQARNTMLATLRRDCRTHHCWIGWQGDSGEYDLDWNPREKFWICTDAFPDENRWIIFLGADEPTSGKMMNIVCEANPPKNGINRQCAGVFLRDTDGLTYFAHSGKIGGGRKGIGKSAFLSAYRGTRETVIWPDTKESEVIVLGCIDSSRFPAQVANFIREVQRFKATASGRGTPAEGGQQLQSPPPEPQFNQEFAGQRRGYRVPSEIEARCDHGLIINALASALQANGLEVANDQSRDLYVLGRDGHMRALFEAKTDVTSSTVYQAIGQLLYHSATEAPSPTLVMVLPAPPDATTKRVLDRLQIKVLVFGWQGRQPVFPNLTDVVGS